MSYWSVGIPYGCITWGSAWQLAQSAGTLSGLTFAVGSDAFLMSWTPWQSMQIATRVSAAVTSRCPWTLVMYCAYWSVERPYCRMRAGSEWQLPHTPTVVVRPGLPMKPADFDIATPISSERGSPPWQSAHPTPAFPWTLPFHSLA